MPSERELCPEREAKSLMFLNPFARQGKVWYSLKQKKKATEGKTI